MFAVFSVLLSSPTSGFPRFDRACTVMSASKKDFPSLGGFRSRPRSLIGEVAWNHRGGGRTDDSGLPLIRRFRPNSEPSRYPSYFKPAAAVWCRSLLFCPIALSVSRSFQPSITAESSGELRYSVQCSGDCEPTRSDAIVSGCPGRHRDARFRVVIL